MGPSRLSFGQAICYIVIVCGVGKSEVRTGEFLMNYGDCCNDEAPSVPAGSLLEKERLASWNRFEPSFLKDCRMDWRRYDRRFLSLRSSES